MTIYDYDDHDYDYDQPADQDFLDQNSEITKHGWKDYWRFQEQDPDTKREIRKRKSATKRRIHKKNRRGTKDQLRNIKGQYKF